ncbi:MAG: zinc ribbon domain-containing protein [Anaerolineae bacterium]|nr:zinc ribbon domain-containing protein [Anaerolineae bacterium]
MSEIRCPMCGKSNPEHSETCQYCQARLTPLMISGDEANSGLPDWFNNDTEEESIPAVDSDSEDWLNRLRPEDDSEEDEDATPFEDSGDDWLGRMRAFDDEETDDETEAEEESSIFDGKLPEWMSSDESAENTPADTDDWLASLGNDSAKSPAPEAQPEASEELPDWMLGDNPPASTPTAEPAAEAEDAPDWLLTSSHTSDAAPAAESAPDIPATSPEAEPELPDWLAGATTEAESSSPTPEGESEALPDWMFSTSDEQPFAAAPSGDSSPDDDLPDWMSDKFTAEKATDGIPDWMSGEEDETLYEDALHAAELPTILPDTSPLTPDWPTGFAEDSQTADESGEADETLIPGDNFEPDWLGKLGSDDSAAEFFEMESGLDDDDDGLFALGELSDAFSDGTDDAPTLAGEAAPADLPDWLHAMRPVESSADDSPATHGPVEQAGPLAGLSGLLIAEPEIAGLKKAPTFSSKLKVTQAQQEHVHIFRKLLESESHPKSVREPIQISSQNLLRWVSAILLILVIILGVVSESQSVPPPSGAAIPAGMLQISELIETLTPTDPVLIAFDYEPGTSGEMNAAAAAVVDHLMLKGAYLSLVSTSPTGPALAEHFIHTVVSQHGYTSGNQYTNLGYIPGGAAGLLGFVQMTQHVTPLTFDGLDAWHTPALSQIQTLANYKLVVVISDDPDIARSWIEQVQPTLQNAPMIAIVSAQVEPILHPYASGEKPQLKGLISGISGGAAYEQVIGKPNLARTYWDTLNYALMAAVVVLLIGSGVNLMTFFVKKKPTGETA